MIRTCNGQDPHLVTEEGVPCACGLTFDDVERMVIYPHVVLPPKRSLEELEALVPGLREFLDKAVGEPYRFDPSPGSFADDFDRLLRDAHDRLFDTAMGVPSSDQVIHAGVDRDRSEPRTVRKLAAYVPVAVESLLDAGLLTEEQARAQGWQPTPVPHVPWHRRLRGRWQPLREALGVRVGSWLAGVELRAWWDEP